MPNLLQWEYVFSLSLWLEHFCSAFCLPDAAPLSRCYHGRIPSSSSSVLQNVWQVLVLFLATVRLGLLDSTGC